MPRREPADAADAPDGDEVAAVAARYARFAAEESARSPIYRAWAEAVAADAGAQRVLARLPANRRQPPLAFAVARMLGASTGAETEAGAGGGPDDIAAWLVRHDERFVAEASHRLLQTNEPGRAALVLAGLQGIDGPIALLELGASAGICLYPDRFAYRFAAADGPTRLGAPGAAPELACAVRGGPPPAELPRIVWRAGLDLQPLRADDPADRTFLRGLAWPEEHARAARIDDALAVVAADPPLLVAGDIARGDATDPGDLEALAARAPSGATLVVSSPGVTPHLPWAVRERLGERIAALGARWLSIDPPPRPDGGPAPAGAPFALRLDGAAIAHVDPLGAWLEWLPGMGPVAG